MIFACHWLPVCRSMCELWLVQHVIAGRARRFSAWEESLGPQAMVIPPPAAPAGLCRGARREENKLFLMPQRAAPKMPTNHHRESCHRNTF